MAEAAPQNTPTQTGGSPADLLQKLGSGKNFPGKFEDRDEETEEIELSLGLSLNGMFGVDPKANKLKRSSSIPEFMNINPVKEDNGSFRVSPATGPLARTYSLPTETEEELRKRKELQSLRRMEAKRKRYEKQRNAKVCRDRYKGSGEENGEPEKQREGAGSRHLQEQFSAMRIPSSVSVTGAYGVAVNGSKNSPEAKSTAASIPRSPEAEQKPAVSPNTKNTANSGNIAGKYGVPKNGAKEIARSMLEEMPCVTTRGEGPNGRRIEGFLYRFGKEEEVRIVCVCHGSFLTPAEFVKHAGGGDVAHPLKHIVVTPSFL